jgi:hypothetical protein
MPSKSRFKNKRPGADKNGMRNYFLLCFLLLSVSLTANNQVSSDENGDGRADTWTVFEEGRRETVLYDSDFDGQVDFALKYGKKSQIIEQQQDFNRDGGMDDFYFFENEVLIRREMDTNYDGEIDIWVYLKEGIYITRYEQDTDFDGEIDKVKSFEAQ